MFNIVVSEMDISAIKSLSYRDREILKDVINRTEPSNFLTVAKNVGIICPICGNGSGKYDTGITSTLNTRLNILIAAFFRNGRKRKTPRVIILASNTTFLARLAVSIESLPSNIQKTVKAKQHFGVKMLFNATDFNSEKLIIVVEGYIDAMSIWQSTNGTLPVVALD